MSGVLDRLRDVLPHEHPDAIRAEANIALLTSGDLDGVLGRLAGRIGIGHPSVTAVRNRRLLHRLPDPY